jgi:sugar lactone lactonase YvrE
LSLFSNWLEQSVSSFHVGINTNWRQNGITIAGGNGRGSELNQLSSPYGIYVDDDGRSMYIADSSNHRIVEWKLGAKNGQVVAGGNGEGNRTDQLRIPTDVIFDKTNDSFIISDKGNRRVVRWSARNDKNGQIIISDISCWGLAMDDNGNLYVSDWMKAEVKRWKAGETNGTIVAGGNGEGSQLDQLNYPAHIFVDQEYAVYVTDWNNHRVMKWLRGAKQGIVVAGWQGEGNSLRQLSFPQTVIVDQLGQLYVADSFNHRVMRWCSEAREGSIVVGSNEEGQEPKQFKYIGGLSFDREGNLYVVDYGNDRVQKFLIDSDSNCS